MEKDASFEQMVLGQLDICIQNDEFGHITHTHTHTHTHRLNIDHKHKQEI